MRILIGIHGSHSRPEYMHAQRETWVDEVRTFKETQWLSDWNPIPGLEVECGTYIDYRYCLGQPDGTDEDVEYIATPDGPVWNGPARTWHLNRKTEALVAYALRHEYDYLFKCDDDTYVHLDRMLLSRFEQHDYSGTTEPHYSFSGLGHYRWAQGGAGYWLSRKAMEIIANTGLTVIPAEDFAVGNVLASHGIHPFHDDRYVSQMTPADINDPNKITLHKVTPALMRHIHGL